MASTRIYRTAGTPTSTKKFTLSFWLKKSVNGADQFVFNTTTDANNRSQVEFNTDDEMNFICKVSGTNIGRLRTTRKFRDPSAWYHIVAVLDTTQLTSSNRMKLYVNGVQETVFTTETYPSQDADANVSGTHTVGSYYNGSSASNYLNGVLTHVHFTDGYAYDASDFGQTNATSGIWTAKTAPNVTYGTNGFFLKFENAGNLDLDSSGNNLSFTTSGTLTQNVDTPTNNFGTLNLLSTHGNNTLTVNNTKIAFTANTSYTNCIGNIGVNNGRWYAECKLAGVTTYYPALGIASMGNATNRYYDPLYTGAHLGADEGTAYFKHGNIQAAGSNVGNYASFTTGDIIGMYLDLESATKTLKYYKNDGLIVSINITPVDGQFYTFGATGTSSSDIADFNFGGGFFGTTAVASANADANGFGAFEYSPTLSGVNYYALCTKNIKEFG
jgi:hypothetical protein